MKSVSDAKKTRAQQACTPKKIVGDKTSVRMPEKEEKEKKRQGKRTIDNSTMISRKGQTRNEESKGQTRDANNGCEQSKTFEERTRPALWPSFVLFTLSTHSFSPFPPAQVLSVPFLVCAVRKKRKWESMTKRGRIRLCLVWFRYHRYEGKKKKMKMKMKKKVKPKWRNYQTFESQ